MTSSFNRTSMSNKNIIKPLASKNHFYILSYICIPFLRWVISVITTKFWEYHKDTFRNLKMSQSGFLYIYNVFHTHPYIRYFKFVGREPNLILLTDFIIITVINSSTDPDQNQDWLTNMYKQWTKVGKLLQYNEIQQKIILNHWRLKFKSIFFYIIG